ncbi:MAG: AAA family ATPase [Oscillospiraceae bacterium]|nr:AAA family ATPase [Oscillospiraceae bacterium]
MFLGREKELKKLNELYEKDGFQFAIMYGRKHVGKTTLISEFVRNKLNIFFVSQEYDNQTALAIFSKRIYTFFKLNRVTNFPNWNSAFDFITEKAKDERIILVLDEFHYLVNTNKFIPSILKNLIEHKMKNSKLFLIICGSRISFMDNKISSMSTLMKIEPLNFIESSKFVPNYCSLDKIITYSITGGIPYYLQKFSDTRTIKENVVKEILNKSSHLYEEPRNLLRQGLREIFVYNSIIEAIAEGNARIDDISTKVDLESEKCSKYLHLLIELDILKKEPPAGEVENRRSIFRITDNYFKFWFRFIFNNIEFIEQDCGETLYDNLIEPYLSDYIRKNVFKDVCAEYLKIQNIDGKLPFIFTKIGGWWGVNHTLKTQLEIDLLALGKDDSAIFCECKWKDEPIDMLELNKLRVTAEVFKKYSHKIFALFSKMGFTGEVIDESNRLNNIILVDLEKLFENRFNPEVSR